MGLQLACTACFVSPGINSFLQRRAFSHLGVMLDAFSQNEVRSSTIQIVYTAVNIKEVCKTYVGSIVCQFSGIVGRINAGFLR